MNYGLIPASVCETLYRESGKFGGRQLLVAAFFLFLRSLCYSFFLLFSCVIPWAFILRVTTLI